MQQCETQPHVKKIAFGRVWVLLKTPFGNEWKEMSSSPPLKPLHLFSSLFFSVCLSPKSHPFTLSAPMKINSYHMKRFYSLSLLLSPLSDVVSITSDNVIEDCFVFTARVEKKNLRYFCLSCYFTLFYCIFLSGGGGQLVKFFTFFVLPPQVRPAGVHKYAR